MQTPSLDAFVDELQKIAQSRSHQISDEDIEWMLKEAGFLGAIGTGIQRGAQAVGRGAQTVGRGITNQTQQLGMHMGNAMSHANSNAILNPTLPVPGIGAAISGGAHFLASKLPQQMQGAAAKGLHAAVPSLNPMTVGAGHMLGHALEHVMPGMGGLGPMASRAVAEHGLPMLTKKFVPAAHNFVHGALEAKIS